MTPEQPGRIIVQGKILGYACQFHEDDSSPTDEQRANALLFAEAGTIVNETGKSLRQLADEHKELRDSLRELQDWCRAHASPVHNPEVLPIMVKAHTILEKTEEVKL